MTALLTLPVATADIDERVFSLMNIIKTKLRNNFEDDMLDCLLRAKANADALAMNAISEQEAWTPSQMQLTKASNRMAAFYTRKQAAEQERRDDREAQAAAAAAICQCMH
jgi:hypothetical protein